VWTRRGALSDAWGAHVVQLAPDMSAASMLTLRAETEFGVERYGGVPLTVGVVVPLDDAWLVAALDARAAHRTWPAFPSAATYVREASAGLAISATPALDASACSSARASSRPRPCATCSPASKPTCGRQRRRSPLLTGIAASRWVLDLAATWTALGLSPPAPKAPASYWAEFVAGFPPALIP
jgi:hypothetical protein